MDDVKATYTVNASSKPAWGTWTLRVEDSYPTETGHLDSWKLASWGL
ncbi:MULTISPECIES: proprotein convertase P-domain-containing protein [Streptomyces]|nr:proprotein convertase P-domain-containing protein [Streptomyces sp. NEAU-383]